MVDSSTVPFSPINHMAITIKRMVYSPSTAEQKVQHQRHVNSTCVGTIS
jgi:hypothetical protein